MRIHRVLLSVFQTAIANATTLAEVERLKGLLQAGQIPGRERKSGNSVLLLPSQTELTSLHCFLMLCVIAVGSYVGRAKQGAEKTV